VVTVYWAKANSYVVTKFGQFLMILYYTKNDYLKILLLPKWHPELFRILLDKKRGKNPPKQTRKTMALVIA
jgi:hypothetical protein